MFTSLCAEALSNYGAVLLKKCAGSEGDKADVPKFFGYIGLFTLLGLWWLGTCIRLMY